MRAIHIFPRFSNIEVIERLRAKYDPLYNSIPPHITLVFPFDDEMSTHEVISHCQTVCSDLSKFYIMCEGLYAEHGAEGGYLFLDVKLGKDTIVLLHDKLYSGPMLQHLNQSILYVAHITVGRFSDEKAAKVALIAEMDFSERFAAIVDEVVIESIQEDDSSEVIARISL